VETAAKNTARDRGRQVDMCVCVYVYVYTCISICMHISMYVCKCVFSKVSSPLNMLSGDMSARHSKYSARQSMYNILSLPLNISQLATQYTEWRATQSTRGGHDQQAP